MKCPSCSFENTKVVDSRISDGGTSIRRRRECEKCEFRFTTFERAQLHNLMVRKKDGTVEHYDREKLERAILVACGKRPISLEKVREKLSKLICQQDHFFSCFQNFKTKLHYNTSNSMLFE